MDVAVRMGMEQWIVRITGLYNNVRHRYFLHAHWFSSMISSLWGSAVHGFWQIAKGS